MMAGMSFVAFALRIPSGSRLATNWRSFSSSHVAFSQRDTFSFKPPEPPSSKGHPVYEDIDFSRAQDPLSESVKRNSDPDAVFVVNGSSRGIGLQFVKSLFERTQGKIVACCRSPDTAKGLKEFLHALPTEGASGHDRVDILRLDMEDQRSIDAAAVAIERNYNRVDGLFNVAGVLGDGTSTPGPERSLSKLDRDWVEHTMSVNIIGPIMLSKALSPMMKCRRRGKARKSATVGEGPPAVPEDRAKTVVACLSARVGSISDNELGGWYSYRFSKAALNQAVRTMSHELKRQGTWTISLHPGTTNTDLSKPFQKNVQADRLFPVEFTVGQLLDVVDSMEEVHSGGLYDWAGKALPF